MEIPSPRRDKFASLKASQTTTPSPSQQAPSTLTARRDKFASLAAKQQTQQKQLTSDTAGEDQRTKKLKSRFRQRKSVLRDLEKAEGLTWNLVRLAGQTATSLKDLQDEKTAVLNSSAKQYQSTLQQVHSLLAPYSKLVVAYRNHLQEDDANNMYAARVGMRLAQERRDVVADLCFLEKESKRSKLDSQPE